MTRRSSVAIFGLLAAGAGAAAMGACSSDDSSATPVTDAGADRITTPSDTSVAADPCTGDPPIMTAFDPATATQVDPDWSCYATEDAGAFLALDASDDAPAPADDAGDAGDAGDAEVDAAREVDASPDAGRDAGTPPSDGGPDAGHVLKVSDFLTHAETPGAAVDLFYGSSAGGAPDLRGTTDSAGALAYVPPAAARLLTYRVNARVDPSDDGKSLRTLLWYDNVIVPPPAALAGSSITKKETALLVSGILGSQAPDATTGTLVTGMQDCQGRQVTGATLEIVDDATHAVVPTGKGSTMKAAYFLSLFPNLKCTYTTALTPDDQSVWGVVGTPVNMPGHTHGYTLRARGRRKTDATAVVLGERPLELWADQITVARPYRLSVR